MSKNTIEFTDANFSELVLKSSLPVLVDFWAEWCGPCRMIAPSVEQIAEEYQKKAVVGKLDVDSNPLVATQYSIRSIPTLLIFKNGEMVDKIIGAVSKQVLAKKLDDYLN